MKNEVKKELKQKGRGDIFSEERFAICKEVMKIGMGKDNILKAYLNISPDFKVDFIVDNMIKFVDLGKM